MITSNLGADGNYVSKADRNKAGLPMITYDLGVDGNYVSKADRNKAGLPIL